MLARRLSFVRYRVSPRFARHRTIVGADGVQPIPRFGDLLSVYLASRLPTHVVARLNLSGLQRVSRFTESTTKLVGRLFSLLLRPAWWFLHTRRTLGPALHARRLRTQLEAAHTVPVPEQSNVGIILDGRVLIEGFEVKPTAARLWLRAVKPVAETCQVFVHLFPEHQTALPEDRRIHGYLCKDHYPTIEIKQWKPHRSFRDEIALEDVPPGFYRIEIGLIDVKTFREFPVDGSDRTSIDLGWIRVGDASGENNGTHGGTQ